MGRERHQVLTPLDEIVAAFHQEIFVVSHEPHRATLPIAAAGEC